MKGKSDTKKKSLFRKISYNKVFQLVDIYYYVCFPLNHQDDKI